MRRQETRQLWGQAITGTHVLRASSAQGTGVREDSAPGCPVVMLSHTHSAEARALGAENVWETLKRKSANPGDEPRGAASQAVRLLPASVSPSGSNGSCDRWRAGYCLPPCFDTLSCCTRCTEILSCPSLWPRRRPTAARRMSLQASVQKRALCGRPRPGRWTAREPEAYGFRALQTRSWALSPRNSLAYPPLSPAQGLAQVTWACVSVS